ncbi:helix-turn-helix domain-containing protein [Thalassobacillus hwangdonensis]|uniref:Helix-turn-helix domain-containing protein n=1 Tax=Thalassobacillus hwangdonensis TaxID=546108 RepID=A0ABW3L2N8_9BACI
MKGLLIRQERLKQQMTQEDLAFGVCSVSYLSKIEHDSIKPSEEIYHLLGERLGLDMSSVNDTFDNAIYDRLHMWHDSIKNRDSAMHDLYQSLTKSMQNHYHIDLTNLYLIFEFRYSFTIQMEKDKLSNKLKLLQSVYEYANLQYKFFYHKIIGIYHLSESELKKGLSHFKQANALLSELPMDDSELSYYIALVYSRLDSYAESIIYTQKAIDNYQNSLNYSKVIDCYLLMAINYSLLRIFDVAQEYLDKILLSAGDYLTNKMRGKVYHNMGYSCINNNKYEEGLEYLNIALRIKKKEKLATHPTIYLIALAHFSNSNSKKAEKFAEEGAKQALEAQDTKYQYSFAMLVEQIHGTHLSESFIEKLVDEIIPFFKMSDERTEYIQALRLLGEIYYENKKYKSSSQCFKIASHINLYGKEEQ